MTIDGDSIRELIDNDSIIPMSVNQIKVELQKAIDEYEQMEYDIYGLECDLDEGVYDMKVSQLINFETKINTLLWVLSK